MKQIKNMSQAELAAYVQDALQVEGKEKEYKIFKGKFKKELK